ncbi:uncharacterized protein LOC108909590 [Anoplophora glabripennis]|uniref:uncharacterized protein LOC108909590 n=1 Tax=Anoplophora glabripennis TaxID=217634 RepID=UPI000874843D|nr:uncharacterized protein LOC108909590 [Anoplophora glabripennis]
MNPKNIYSTLLLGNNFDYVLFKAAILFAESGLKVWFISPETFDKIPENIVAPEKEILQLITFLYLKDYKELISHLNGIHLWHKVPDVVILPNLEIYCNLHSDKYDPLLSALIVTALVDSTSVCAKKNQRAYLIATCSISPENCENRLQILHDMYFPHVVRESEENETLLKDIVDYYLNN